MARGPNNLSFMGVGDSSKPCDENDPAKPLGQVIADSVGIATIGGNLGDPLENYDIKSQDALTMLRLSLLAAVDGARFVEPYIDVNGKMEAVKIGEDQAPSTPPKCIMKKIYHQFVNKVDHVVVRGSDPLPTRYFSGGSVNLMGGTGSVYYFNIENCASPNAEFTGKNSVGNEAWVEFSRSPQSVQTQEALRGLVDRPNWEQLVGYRHILPEIPPTVSMSVSQTTPRNAEMLIGEIESSISFNIGSNAPDGGGIVDISNVNVVSAPILDIVKGSTILSDLLGGNQADAPPNLNFGDTDYYVMLDHTCGLNGLSKGKEWFLLGNDLAGATVTVKSHASDSIAYEAFSTFATDFVTQNYIFRRSDGTIASFSDFINANVNPPKDDNGNPQYPARPPFDEAGGAFQEAFDGTFLPGMGGNFGLEVTQPGYVSYTVQKPSIQLRGQPGLLGAANAAAGTGIVAEAILVKDKPAPIGCDGDVVEQPSPPQEPEDPICPESKVETLEGIIIDMSAPWLTSDGAVAQFSQQLKEYINEDNGTYQTRTYDGVPFNWLPGQMVPGIDKAVIHNIDITYGDKDSRLTNVTLGPKYYQVQSFNDSQYVRRSVTLTRTGRVVSGRNSSGAFVVGLDGLGSFNALNGTTEPIYVGDRVEVKVLNYPVEP